VIRGDAAISRVVLFALLINVAGTAEALGEVDLEVVYPKNGQRIAAVDSTFILGNTTPGAKLKINGIDVPVHEEGGFLAFLDVSPGEFTFELEARKDQESKKFDVVVKIADLRRSVPPDSIAILSEFDYPNVYQELIPGDLLEVSFRGTPGGTAYFGVEGLVDRMTMVEGGREAEGSWTYEAFGEVPERDERPTSGVYFGSMYIPDSADVDSAAVVFSLQIPEERLAHSAGQKATIVGQGTDFAHAVLTDTARGTITVHRPAWPQVVELKDSVQTVRVGPRKGYLSIFQPAGVRFICNGRYSNYVRVDLAPGVTGWVPDTSVIFLAPGSPTPHSHIRTIRSTASDSGSKIEIFLDEKLPFRVEHRPEEGKVEISVFYGTSDTDWIKYFGSGGPAHRLSWRQVQDGVYSVVAELDDRPLWGWDAYYEGTTLTVDLRPAPEEVENYHGIRIMIDPGHSRDPGSIGPTGLTEAEANLAIADVLASLLRHRGATVFMTRIDDSDVKLYDRPGMAVERNCDIFISIHNNALPDGVNPFENNGVSTYYYHPHSKPLADFVHTSLVEQIGLPDYGLYHANFAVLRPTQYVSILVECAFMIIPEQESALKTTSFQEECAKAILAGLDSYLKSLNSD
jgi:N-acetylmuramoyl-L-alanine amidase